MGGEAGGREAARASEPLFGVQISPSDAESLWSMELPPRPKLRVCTARADGEEGGPEETEGGQEEDCEEGGPEETDGGQEEGYREEEMSGLNKQKELTRVCGATNPSPGYAANGRGDSRPERAAGKVACVWDYGLNYV